MFIIHIIILLKGTHDLDLFAEDERRKLKGDGKGASLKKVERGSFCKHKEEQIKGKPVVSNCRLLITQFLHQQKHEK
jgi:hypothetical protein